MVAVSTLHPCVSHILSYMFTLCTEMLLIMSFHCLNPVCCALWSCRFLLWCRMLRVSRDSHQLWGLLLSNKRGCISRVYIWSSKSLLSLVSLALFACLCNVCLQNFISHCDEDLLCSVPHVLLPACLSLSPSLPVPPWGWAQTGTSGYKWIKILQNMELEKKLNS